MAVIVNNDCSINSIKIAYWYNRNILNAELHINLNQWFPKLFFLKGGGESSSSSPGDILRTQNFSLGSVSFYHSFLHADPPTIFPHSFMSFMANLKSSLKSSLKSPSSSLKSMRQNCRATWLRLPYQQFTILCITDWRVVMCEDKVK